MIWLKDGEYHGLFIEFVTRACVRYILIFAHCLSFFVDVIFHG
jgi:hypothetical protein